MNDDDIVGGDSQFVGYDLGKRRFLSLPVRRRAGKNGDLARWFNSHVAAFPTAGRHGDRWSHRANFHVRREADAHVFSLLAKFGLLLAQGFVAGSFQRQIERRFVIRAVVHDATRRLEGELVRLREILSPQLGGIHV